MVCWSLNTEEKKFTPDVLLPICKSAHKPLPCIVLVYLTVWSSFCNTGYSSLKLNAYGNVHDALNAGVAVF